MIKILATGTSGTIGKHFKAQVKTIPINLLHDFKLPKDSYFNTSSVFLHAAGIVGDKAVLKDLEISHKVNIDGLRKLALICKDSGVEKFIYVSTSHVYAPSEKLLSETSKIDPIGPYGQQKLEAERLLLDIFQNTPHKLCIVRVFSILDWDVPSFTLGGAIKKLATASSFSSILNSSDIRDFLTPRVVAETLVKISLTSSINGIVNLSSGVGISVAEATRSMLIKSGFEFPTKRVLLGNSAQPYIVGDNSKLISFLPDLCLVWQPSIYTNIN